MGVYTIQTQFARMVTKHVVETAAPDEYMGAPASPVRPVVQAAEEIMRLPSPRTLQLVLTETYDATNWLLTPLPDGQTDTTDRLEPRLIEWGYAIRDRENSKKLDGVGYPSLVYKDGTNKINRLAVTAPVERPITVHVEFIGLVGAFTNPDFVPPDDFSGYPGLGGVAGVGIKWACVAGPQKGAVGWEALAVSIILGGVDSGLSVSVSAQFVVPRGCTYEFNIDGGIGTNTSAGGVGLSSQPYLIKFLGEIAVASPLTWKGFSGFDGTGEAATIANLTSMTVTTY